MTLKIPKLLVSNPNWQFIDVINRIASLYPLTGNVHLNDPKVATISYHHYSIEQSLDHIPLKYPHKFAIIYLTRGQLCCTMLTLVSLKSKVD